MSEKFWVEDFSVLFNNIKLIPTNQLSRDENLNILTRLVIVATAVLYLLKYVNWFVVGVCGVLFLILYRYNGPQTREGFSVTPTVGPGAPTTSQTYINPLFAEEWEINPHLKNEALVGNPVLSDPYASALLSTEQQPYPYGQYISHSNVMPMNELQISAVATEHDGLQNLNGGARVAREFANSEFTRHSLAHRENLMSVYKKKFNRRFQQNPGYSASPFRDMAY